MKKYAISTFTLLFFSFLLPNVYRMYNNGEIKTIHPFFLSNEKISLAWYLKDCGDLISFSMIVLVVCLLLNLIEKYLKSDHWTGNLEITNFVNLWQLVFWIIFFSSVLDFVHYLIAFKQIQWFFLIQSGLFLIVSCHYICKAYRK